jgi:hypothetical protein
MSHRAAAVALAIALGLGGPAAADTVRAEEYDAFWLWGAVQPRPALAAARSLYLLQGTIDAPSGQDSSARLIAQGGAVPRLRHGEIWLAYRAHTLHWTPQVYIQILARLRRWRAAGNPVVGVQIDFDARTRHLEEYARFLNEVRAHLPADCKLGITGLLDWSSQGDPAALTALGAAVDEIVLQTYQGRRTIPGYQTYLARVGRMRMPFKIGLVEGGDWNAPLSLSVDPWFRGYVVFLTNGKPTDGRDARFAASGQ